MAAPCPTFCRALRVHNNLPGQARVLPGNRIVAETDDICHFAAVEVLRVDGLDTGVIGEDDDKLIPPAIGSQPLHFAHQEVGQYLQCPAVDLQVLLPVCYQDLHLGGRVRGRGACWSV